MKKKEKNEIAVAATRRKIGLVKAVVAARLQADKVYDELHKLMGLEPESRLGRALFDPVSKILELTSELIGDDGAWLSWFIWDNDCGSKGFLVQWPCYDSRGRKRMKSKNVRTPQDLVYVMEASVDPERKCN